MDAEGCSRVSGIPFREFSEDEADLKYASSPIQEGSIVPLEVRSRCDSHAIGRDIAGQ